MTNAAFQRKRALPGKTTVGTTYIALPTRNTRRNFKPSLVAR
jgi:hypothetical protein